jgi:hypothetical protein
MESDSNVPLSSVADSDLKDAYKTMMGLPTTNDTIAIRLQKISELLKKQRDMGDLPQGAVLLWEGSDGTVRHICIRKELVVGRQPDEGGLAFPNDQTLSRKQHFLIRNAGHDFILEDKSSNGTAINEPKNRIKNRILRDGDIVFAGNQIFVFFLRLSTPL